jgi:hypothetical protein
LPVVPPGEYIAIFSWFRERNDLKFSPSFELHFKIDDGQFKGTIVNCLARESNSPKSKLFGIITAILGKEPEKIDLDELIGKPCIIVVRTVKGRDSDYSQVVEVKPLK